MSGEDLDGHKVEFPIYGYLSPKEDAGKSKPSFWILSGIHGEEPAGPNALAESVGSIIQLNKSDIPVVFCPLLNPLGYCRDDRYFNAHRMEGSGRSITDAEHLLLDISGHEKPRQNKPSNLYAKCILNWCIKTSKPYPPLIVMDHHEDEIDQNENHHIDSGVTYSYASGHHEKLLDICKLITDVLKKSGFPIQENGVTRFGEKVENGFVTNIKDGSIDEFLTATEYFQETIKFKQAASAVFAIETTRDDDKNIPLRKRIEAHKAIIELYQDIWLEIAG